MFDSVKVEDFGTYVVVDMRGQFIGGDETDTLRDRLKDLSEDPSKTVILNMEKVTYLNSTALGALISAHHKFTAGGGKLVLCSLGDNIENIFVITKLTLVFEIGDSVEDAIEKYI